MRFLGCWLAVMLTGCAATWTPQDRSSETSAEALAMRLYQHNADPDAGDPLDRAYSRGIVCALQASLVAHDAGRVAGPIDCRPEQRP